ncbi:hypothetical protein EJ08DRAFT_654126 [Tothia fuscella]|uniref:Zn(2)-C6 fungal-type domain-containing protein n=1 Tax=Tothia fuscella TaxID=1048955 RepID=A0A9P4NFT7_9PEZI|nr:hypothetical protein EJ08DRAFT_654126 [Tothia fuscella]
MGNMPELSTTTLYTTSCTECHRRKQKCSKSWPCNHCQSRKVSHLCQYTQRKTSTDVDSAKADPLDAKKRKWDTPNTDLLDDNHYAATADALKSLGYLELSTDFSTGKSMTTGNKSFLQRETEDLLNSIPPKAYCDAMVQNYVQVSNYQYYILYSPKFLEQYVRWWEQRARRENVDPEFTCLLFRVLAISSQSYTTILTDKVAAELGEDLQDLTDKYHRAAARISAQIPPGSGTIMQVQQLLMSAAWYKGENLFIESWHALASAIRQAQELGMHDDKLGKGMTEFDQEMRRRVWCILYDWDRSMGMVLARPFIIHDGQTSVPLPTVNLEHDPANPDVPSPIMQMTMGSQLLQSISGVLEFSRKRPSTTDGLACLKIVENWCSNLPPVYAIDHPDTSCDTKYPFLVRHRLQSHCICYATVFTILKPYLTEECTSSASDEIEAFESLRRATVDYGLKLMSKAQLLYNLFIPANPKYFFVVFLPFDTSTFFCSALLHDRETTLPRRSEIIQAIGKGISMLNVLRLITKTGPITWNVLARLVLALDISDKEAMLLDPEGLILKRKKSAKRVARGQRMERVQQPLSPEEQPSQSLLTPEFTASSNNGGTPESDVIPEFGDEAGFNNGADFDWQFDPIPVLDAASFTDIDFGEFASVWDWEDLNLPLEDLAFPYQPHITT